MSLFGGFLRIVANGRVYVKLGIKRADLFNLQQSKLKAQM